LAFSPDGRQLAVGDYDRRVTLWDLTADAPVPAGDPLPQNDIVLSVAFSPDGRRLAVGTASDTHKQPQARPRDLASRQPVGEPCRHGGSVLRVLFRPDGGALLTGSDDGTARLWDA